MSKSLKNIQSFYNVARIFFKIGFVFSIVGAVGCLIGIATVAGLQDFVVGGKNISDYMLEYGELSMHTAIDNMVAGLIVCIAEAVLLKFAERYCAHELKAGTPFTEQGANEILRLAILNFALPIGASIVMGITHGVFTAVWDDVAELDIDNGLSIMTGLICLLASFIFRYGAELEQKKTAEPFERISEHEEHI